MSDKGARQEVRLAYVISAYKLPRNLIRLVRRLSVDGEQVIVHVDKRSRAAVFDEMFGALEPLPTVHFLARHRSAYASYGHVLATLKGLERLRNSAAAYDFVVLLTGQDYPIKPLSAIRAQFARHTDRTYMSHFRMPAESWHEGGMNRLTRWHFSTPHGLHAVPRRWLGPLVPHDLPFGLVPWGGSGYWTMCRRHVDYVLNFLDRSPAYLRFFRRAGIPDEMFFQTILMNGPHAHEVINDDLRCVDWTRADVPAVFESEDLDLLAARPEPFARKFDSTRDEAILDALDHLAGESSA